MDGDSAPKSKGHRQSNADGNANAGGGGTNMRALIDSAREQFQYMTGRDTEMVSAVRKTDDGWQIDVEVIELQRIPDTTSVLACYAVRVDGNGDVTSYERVRRYTRGQTEI